MKYIRTKDGKISYLDTEPYEDEIDYVVITNKGRMNCYRPDEVVKQADTIEELCDEFVLDEMLGKLGTKEFYNHYYHISIEQVLKNKQSIFGAIWTDKGLIYVAKMNEEGELELL